MTPELARLTERLPRADPADPTVLQAAGESLGIQWPADYVALLAAHNGVEGEVGNWWVNLTAAEDLVEANEGTEEYWPGLVFIGGDGAEERIAFDRRTLEILLVRSDGSGDSWIVLGSTLAEAFGRFERDDVFENPVYHEDVTPPAAPWPDDWRQRIADKLHGKDDGPSSSPPSAPILDR